MPTFLRRIAAAGLVCAVLVLCGDTPGASAQSRGSAQPPGAAWVTAWATSQQALADTPITNATVRVIARVTIPGDAVRVRLDNSYGTDPLTIGRASVGLRIQGAALAGGSVRPLLFHGAPAVTVPAGGRVWSDPVRLPVRAQQDLAVSLYVPGANVRPSQHTAAATTSYRNPDGAGDAVLDESRTPFTATTTSFWWLKAIDVESRPGASAVVAFGDSITDGTCSTLDAHDRWVDVVSMRLGLPDAAGGRSGPARAGRDKALVNEGIGGNTLTRDGLVPPADSTPGLERFDRDVLGHHGVTDVLLFMGTNDIRRGAPAAQVIGATTTLIERIKAKGLRAIGVTMIPRHNVAPNGANTGWNDAKTQIRRAVNQWIRTRAPFDAVIDFDAVVRDPANADLIDPPFNCGDGIHPSPAGYYAMGNSVNLALLRRN